MTARLDGVFAGSTAGHRGSPEATGGRAALPLALALALVATAIAHLPALGNGFTNWDDPGYLLDNPLTEHPLAEGVTGLVTTRSLAYPVPVTVLAYAAERTAFGLSPFAFHLLSLALHLLCVALAAALARRLGARPWPAAGAALLFGLHPVVVEPVAWVVGQKDLIAACLLLAALLVRSGSRGQRPWATALTFLLGLLAIGAKPSAVAVVAILPVLDLMLSRRVDRSAAILYLGLAAIAALSIALGLVGHGFIGGEAPVHFGLRSLAEALWAVWLQARHLVWPDPLLVRYFPPTGAALIGGAAAGALVIAGLVGGCVLAWRRGHREVAFSLAAALLAYAPVSGLVPLSRGPADSYLYLPLALAVVAGARGLGRLAADGRGASRLAAMAAALAAVVLMLASARQTDVWHNSRTLWRPFAERYPDEPRALMRVGDAHLFMNDPGAALEEYEAIRGRFPAFSDSLPAHAASLEALGSQVEAEAILALAVRLDRRPDYLEAYGFFLATHEVAASDDAAARMSLVTVGELLATHGKRAATVGRAARRLRQYGETALAVALDRRLAELQLREPGGKATGRGAR
jgi:protein O-mannosyl-transferase